MKINEVSTYLESIAPRIYQESYDNSGLIIGNPNAELTKALLCLDATDEVVEEAIKLGCNLIIAHHPIIFQAIKQLNNKNYIGKALINAIKNDIAIYACHTNLDNVITGVNKKIANKLTLENTKILLPKKNTLKKLSTLCPIANAEGLRNALLNAGANSLPHFEQTSFNSLGISTYNNKNQQNGELKIEFLFPIHFENTILSALQKYHPNKQALFEISTIENLNPAIGSGIIGTLPSPTKPSDFLQFVKQTMKAGCVKHTRLLNKKINTVAICGGSGSFLLKEAISQNADIYISSDFTYHQFFDANNQIIIADIGHYETEQFTIELFYELLIEKFSNFDAHLTKINTNPVHYI